MTVFHLLAALAARGMDSLMKRRLIRLSLACFFALTASVGRAQFTSSYPYINVAATFNGYETYVPNMILISNGVWLGYQRVQTKGNQAFLFATEDFSTTWKETNQSAFGVPMTGTAEKDAGSDIVITNNLVGYYRFTFDETSRVYSVQDVSYSFTNSDLWVNEFHYDNAGADEGEAIEVCGPAGLVLTNYVIYLYNGGASGQATVYATINLTGTLTNDVAGYGTAVFPYSGIQNGSPDGMALARRSPSTILQLISYEGSMTGTAGVAAGKLFPDIGVQEAGGDPVGFSLQLIGEGSSYSEFTWNDPSPSSMGSINPGQFMLRGPRPASVAISNLVNSPLYPLSNNPVHIEVNISPNATASNISPVAFYRLPTSSMFVPIRMALASNNLYRTVTPIPAQAAGVSVEYYVWVNFAGPGTASPTVYPVGAPSESLKYAVSFSPPGSVWINEIDPAGGSLFDNDIYEFLEIVGRAGTPIGGWKAEFFEGDTAAPAWTMEIPHGVVLPGTTNGYGFYVMGDSNAPGVQLVFTNTAGDIAGLIPDNGAVRLLNEVGVMQDFIRYGSTNLNLPPGSRYIGEDPDGWDPNGDVLAASGSGSNAANFVWVTNGMPSAGSINAGQVLTGGNTNPLPPAILCPADVYYTCTTATIPPPNLSLVVATGLCGNMTTTNSWVSDTTNSGTGCRGNPKIVTRTYKSVSSCKTTNFCTQLFVFEDRNPPTFSYSTATLVNATFASGSLSGWTKMDNTNGIFGVTTTMPYTGAYHAVIASPAPPALSDASANQLSGQYLNGVVRGQPGALPSTKTSVSFDGTNDMGTLPALNLNDNHFTITMWIKRNGNQTTSAGLFFTRTNSSVAGLYFGPTNELRYIWNNAGNTSGFNGGLVPSNGVWTFVGLSISPTNAVLVMAQTNGQIRVVTNRVNHAIEEFDGPSVLGTDPLGGRFYRGAMDDVQLYQESLSSADMLGIFSNGAIDIESARPSLLAYYPLDDEAFVGTSRVFSISQMLPAVSGQTWVATARAAQPAYQPLLGGNMARVELDYLNAATNVLNTYTSAAILNATSPLDSYLMLTAFGRATNAATAWARIRLVYAQDELESLGRVFYDAATLSPFTIIAGAGCPIMTDMRPLISAYDECSVTFTSQFPAVGASVTPGPFTVRFLAADQCGQSSNIFVTATALDTNPPSVTVTSMQASCISDIPAPGTNDVNAWDNCGTPSIRLVNVTNNYGSSCSSSPLVVVRFYEVTDLGGNVVSTSRTFTIIDTNPPSISVAITNLPNPGFEQSMTNWNKWGGTNVAISSAQPESGSKHLVISGQNSGSSNSSGFYMASDFRATNDSVWRAAARILIPTNAPLTGRDTFEIKIEFYSNSYGGVIGAYSTPLVTSNAMVGVYQTISVTATAPYFTAWARIAGQFIQATNASTGRVYVDNLSFGPNFASVYSNSCMGPVPPILPLVRSDDCALLSVTQTVTAGSVYPAGEISGFAVIARDECGLARTTAVQVVIVDDTPPVIVSGPPNIQVANTNQIPAPNTNSIYAVDACGPVNVSFLHEIRNSGTGAIGDPMIIQRYYRVQDSAPLPNPTLYRQVITVVNEEVNSLVKVGNTLTMRSTGTNSWNFYPEFATNLLGPQTWMPLVFTSNIFLNGTNVTTFELPTNAPPIFIRTRQAP